MDLKPLFDRVILKNLKKENTTTCGLIIPESAGDEPLRAEVLAIGNGDCFDGQKSELAVAVHDKVLYNKYGATYFKYKDEEYAVLRQSDILLVIKEED